MRVPGSRSSIGGYRDGVWPELGRGGDDGAEMGRGGDDGHSSVLIGDSCDPG